MIQIGEYLDGDGQIHYSREMTVKASSLRTVGGQSRQGLRNPGASRQGANFQRLLGQPKRDSDVQDLVQLVHDGYALVQLVHG
jgi:hypothetical protein